MEEELNFDPSNSEGITVEFFDEDPWNSNGEEDLWNNEEIEKLTSNNECITKSEWFIAGQYCHPCQERAEEHHTHQFCITCQNICDKNRYPFKDQCICKGKQQLRTPEPSEWSEDSESIEIILEDPESVVHTIVELNNTYWWLPKLQQPSQQHMNEFNNFSRYHLSNSVWWEAPTHSY
jgi:hypothetical protein